jgi:hypothetical protein
MLFFASREGLMSQTNQEQRVRNVVLVHGGFVDGSGWEGVYNALKKSGYAVTVVQEATTSFADDIATTKRAIAEQNGPVILTLPSTVAKFPVLFPVGSEFDRRRVRMRLHPPPFLHSCHASVITAV